MFKSPFESKYNEKPNTLILQTRHESSSRKLPSSNIVFFSKVADIGICGFQVNKERMGNLILFLP